MKYHESTIVVRYAETDQMGIVYHANYLVWMEIGRTDFLESIGLRYFDMEQEGYISPVLDVHISYKQAMKYGQKAVVKTWINSYDGFRIVYGYEIRQEGSEEIHISGETEHIAVRKSDFKPVSTRRAFPSWHEAYLKAMKL
ncbi:acyl-CoA thioesterase [Paenilisteria rocourtiae]|uniref:Acyl-CoA thioester hydrolase n=1 Tax=Listeria rocourtiae TaxID=647910 RepID=A0A4R6ZNL3_9LIST|nr:thioesterase family protein [Listeria rocourtiae]EUJ51082.1 4-hydroxybenzoyl-CoA thioesterase [Listeria rocourtiae FSL F6-920]MBC1434094.1 acyl-CoA thioesterase [Listeria rocourtiae]MBC1603619.1 acyl-CoA thioesterase [Listeria rocourtiae]TDR53975.1 acyl-CoA thioester hydrolase [Listeria rocourtiae]